MTDFVTKIVSYPLHLETVKLETTYLKDGKWLKEWQQRIFTQKHAYNFCFCREQVSRNFASSTFKTTRIYQYAV